MPTGLAPDISNNMPEISNTTSEVVMSIRPRPRRSIQAVQAVQPLHEAPTRPPVQAV